MPRRSNDQALSLFAFQDIITGVAGVMLFILLLLVVQLSIRTAQAVVKKPQTHEKESSGASDEAVEELVQAQAKLAELQKRGATLLGAQNINVDDEIAKAKQELERLTAEAAKKQKEVEETRQKMESEKVQHQKTVAQAVDELTKQIESVQQEKQRWAEGKLATFTATNVQAGQELWMIDVGAESANLFEIRNPGSATRVRYVSTAPTAADVIQKKLSELTQTKTIIILLRPSAAGWGNLLLVKFRNQNYNLALELIDATTQVAANP